MKKHITLALLSLSFLLPQTASVLADSKPSDSILGIWEVIIEEDNKAKSKIYFNEENGKVSGKVIQVYHPESPSSPLICKKCKGDKKNQLIIGMVVIEGLTLKEGKWTGGTLLNPDTGKTHKISVELTDDQQKLNILNSTKKNRYKGSKILGKSLIWAKL